MSSPAVPDSPTSRRRRPTLRGVSGGDRRTRERKTALPVDRGKIVQRVLGFAKSDRDNRQEERGRRLQRQAKLRMWSEAADSFPWPDSSDFAMPDMATASLRTQDTLHNAMMSHRPPMLAKSDRKQNRDKEDTINELLDHQFFVEQSGEQVLEEAAQCFVDEGVLTLFVPWVRDRRPVSKLRFFPKIPSKGDAGADGERLSEDQRPDDYFSSILDQEFPQAQHRRRDPEGWDWEIFSGENHFDVSFFTHSKTHRVEMKVDREMTVHDGPRVMVMEMDDVLTPPRCSNLQPPGPANPGGAPHVILIERPTLDEIKRQQKDGFFDRVTAETLEELQSTSPEKGDNDARQQQKDAMGGEVDAPDSRVGSQMRFEVFVCFDRYDIDGDGLDEDVIWWVLKDGELLLKAAVMTEMYPMDPPHRPFGESTFLPTKGRREGISLLELMESTHDTMKEMWDHMVDAGTLGNSPIGFYRPQSNIKPEVFNLLPGDMYPVNDPSRDVAFPRMGSDQSFSINGITMAKSWQGDVTMIGDLNLGKIPAGKSSAFRTTGTTESVLGQSEARPERILRRFFMAFKQVWWLMHEQNKHLLPDGKKFRIVGYKAKGEDPYREVVSREDIDGAYEFDFQANVANSSKLALQGALQMASAAAVNPLTLQLGIATPETVYNMAFDTMRAAGLDGERYLEAPIPNSHLPRIMAEEAIGAILHDTLPYGLPAEQGGWQEHFEKLTAFETEKDQMGNPVFAVVNTPETQQLFQAYKQKAAEAAAQERKEAQIAEASAQAPGGPPGRPGPQASGQADLSAPPVQGSELLDESLPSAGGGGNTG